jgi:hypothetical protein
MRLEHPSKQLGFLECLALDLKVAYLEGYRVGVDPFDDEAWLSLVQIYDLLADGAGEGKSIME